ncbi:phosphodiester glycosidase family protein [Cohnella hongkongensis]|uniref:Phosphodiester glycosidase family protein n=1 Tax=Cohnella hongkongensis TaxID=178337 RepID=A0ABV9FCQ7_9BACL
MRNQKFRLAARTLGAAALGFVLAGADSGAGGGASPAGEAQQTPSVEARQTDDGALVCPGETVRLPLNAKASLDAYFQYEPFLYYELANPKLARVTSQGVVVPLAKGSTQVEVTASGPDRPAAVCSFRLQVVDPVKFKPAFAPKTESRQTKVNGRQVYVNTIVLPKGMPAGLGLGKDALGSAEAMKAIVTRNQASYAINGTYFAAYNGEVPMPYGTLVKDGELLFNTGSAGTMIAFSADGTARLEEAAPSIDGGLDGLYDVERRWKASYVNRRSGSGTTIYTPEYGTRIGTDKGVMIVVSAGKVAKVTKNENVKIPRDGFVIVNQRESLSALNNTFKIGRKAHYRVTYSNSEGRLSGWNDVVTAVHAWPKLIEGGKVVEKDGSDAKRAARSAIGLTKDGKVVMATTGSATHGEVAQLLRAKGAVEAMGLDGGASAGLYSQGVQLFTPGRSLSNVLLFGPNLR